jgi:hypothetical protein
MSLLLMFRVYRTLDWFGFYLGKFFCSSSLQFLCIPTLAFCSKFWDSTSLFLVVWLWLLIFSLCLSSNFIFNYWDRVMFFITSMKAFQSLWCSYLVIYLLLLISCSLLGVRMDCSMENKKLYCHSPRHLIMDYKELREIRRTLRNREEAI